MTACRSSRLLDCTRSSSPWIWLFTDEGAQRDAALDELLLEDVEHGLDALLGVRLHQDLLAAELERGADILEVVALRDLLLRLTEGVLRLHRVDLADDVE